MENSAEQIENCLTALKDIDYDAAVALMEAGEYTDAMANEAYFNEEYSEKYGEIVNTCLWWLRSPGDLSYYAALVLYGGSLNSFGFYVDGGDDCVRPAFWLNLDS